MVSFADKRLIGAVSAAEWEAFLESDPPGEGVRILVRKKHSAAQGITWVEAVEVALCFGWIDGQSKRHDDDYTQQAFTPRRARSPWSQVNREHVERLTVQGRMRPAGLAEVERAKADGRWDAAYRMSTAEPDPEFVSAISANPQAAAFWESLGRSQRFPFVFRLLNLKRPETRTRRIHEFVEMLARGETI